MNPAPSAPARADGFSVIIPAFNYAQYLSAALQSVLAQTFPHLECLVIDDGSTDETPSVVQAMTDPRIRYIRQTNAGLAAARNRGIAEARYSLLGFLDADDRWKPTFLEQIRLAFAALDPRFGAVASAAERIDEQGFVVPQASFSFGRTGELRFRDFCLRNRPLASSIVLRKAVFAECGGFALTLTSSEDRDFWLRLTARGWRFYFLNEPLAEIRRHSQNMSKSAARMSLSTRLVLQRARAAAPIARWSPFWLRVWSLEKFQSARRFAGEKMTKRTLGLLAASVLLWPCFWSVRAISERPAFRIRALVRLLIDVIRPASREAA